MTRAGVLALRTNPEVALHVSAELALHNLRDPKYRALIQELTGKDIVDLPERDLYYFAYLAHHDGLGGARQDIAAKVAVQNAKHAVDAAQRVVDQAKAVSIAKEADYKHYISVASQADAETKLTIKHNPARTYGEFFEKHDALAVLEEKSRSFHELARTAAEEQRVAGESLKTAQHRMNAAQNNLSSVRRTHHHTLARLEASDGLDQYTNRYAHWFH